MLTGSLRRQWAIAEALIVALEAEVVSEEGAGVGHEVGGRKRRRSGYRALSLAVLYSRRG